MLVLTRPEEASMAAAGLVPIIEKGLAHIILPFRHWGTKLAPPWGLNWLVPRAQGKLWEMPATLSLPNSQELAECKASAFLLPQDPRAGSGAPWYISPSQKAPRAISSNKENNAGEIEFSADLFNLVISEHLVLAVMGEWAASRRFISHFSRIFIGLLNRHESLSHFPYKHE